MQATEFFLSNLRSGIDDALVKLAVHLASSLGCSIEQVNAAISEFTGAAPPVKKTKSAKAAAPVSHSCEHTVNSKEGARLCGKTASKELNGSWFCGTENSGHYKAHLSSVKKSETAPPVKTVTKATPKSTATPKTPPKTAPEVVKKVVKKEQVNLEEVSPGIWADPVTHIAFDRVTMEAYGVVAKNNKTINELGDDQIRYLEVHGFPIREKKPASKKVASPKATAVVTNLKKSIKEAVVEEPEEVEEEEDIDLGEDEVEEEEAEDNPEEDVVEEGEEEVEEGEDEVEEEEEEEDDE